MTWAQRKWIKLCYPLDGGHLVAKRGDISGELSGLNANIAAKCVFILYCNVLLLFFSFFLGGVLLKIYKENKRYF